MGFEADNLDGIIFHLEKHNIEGEPIRIDEITFKRFTFTPDPDNLPMEFHEKLKGRYRFTINLCFYLCKNANKYLSKYESHH